MFLNGKARLAMKRAEQAAEEAPAKPRYDLPVLVRNERGRFVRYYGDLHVTPNPNLGPIEKPPFYGIRTYPGEHARLSKRMYKSPQYCAACHKQFIDEEINRVGWVQLQNQYDNWAASKWYTEGDPARTIECRECHMPLVDSTDPAAGDPSDYNRTPGDRKHRSHRFIAANQFMPAVLQLEGWEEQVRLTEEWLRGEFEIPEIKDKWVEGPIVQIALEAPEKNRTENMQQNIDKVVAEGLQVPQLEFQPERGKYKRVELEGRGGIEFNPDFLQFFD